MAAAISSRQACLLWIHCFSGDIDTASEDMQSSQTGISTGVQPACKGNISLL